MIEKKRKLLILEVDVRDRKKEKAVDIRGRCLPDRNTV